MSSFPSTLARSAVLPTSTKTRHSRSAARCRCARVIRTRASDVEDPAVSPVSAPANFTPPEPQPLSVTRPGEQAAGLLSASAALALRLGSGAFVLGWTPNLVRPVEGQYCLMLGPVGLRDTSPVLEKAPRPGQPLVLYEYEASPFCRKVREVGALLDIPVLCKPCPGARSGFSDELFEKTGRRTVPYLEDPNTGEAMFESEDIIDYLLQRYGPDPADYDAKALWPMRGDFALWTGGFASVVRGFAGAKPQENARPDNQQMQPLELWGYECSPFVRPVREKLGALCLPHVVVNSARGSARRDEMVARTGRQFQVPFLVDPNTGVEMFESPEIVEYLDQVYTTGN